jgi:hypothetical protein
MSRPDANGGPMRDPVRFARNAAIFSGVPACIVIVLGIFGDNVALIVLPSLVLLCAITGVMIWARQERHRKERNGS